MLTFQPAFDPFHSIFRLLRLLPIYSERAAVEKDKARILDFYLTFPFRAGDIRFKSGQTGLRKIAKGYEHLRPYGGLPDDRELMRRMAPVQKKAAETLAARGIVDGDAYKQGIILAGAVTPPDNLSRRATEMNAEQRDLISMLQSLCEDYPLFGVNGLKDRTGLLDHRYDAI